MPEKEEEYDEYDDYEAALDEIAPADDEQYDKDGDEAPQEQVSQSRMGSGTSLRSSASGGSATSAAPEEAKFTFSGYEVVFWEDTVDEKYLCVVCNQILRYPVQFEECGHRCCSSCLSDLLR